MLCFDFRSGQMGRATRWLKGLFGMKNNRDKKQNSNSDHRGKLKYAPALSSVAPPPNHVSPSEAAWFQSFYGEAEDQQNKHAIAVAAATAAAADAAVAAAQAAVAVVRLTNHSRNPTMLGRGHEKFVAAVKIQTVFRGFLARKALRALKGLVKIQALVRGFLVRKQATATLHSMQALIRAQATVRSQKSHQVMKKTDESYKFETLPRRSTERFDESRRLSSSFESNMNNNAASTDGSPTPKIVEVDTGGCRPRSRSRRSNTSMSDFGDDPLFQTLSSPIPVAQIRTPGWMSMAADQRALPEESECGLTGEEYKFSTAQSTPRFTNSCSCTATPKSICAERLVWQCGNYPSYMANTQSSKAKLRSRSAPKQRPESVGGAKKRLSLNEMMESRSSLSGVRMQRTCTKVQEAINFKNAVMGKIEKSGEIRRESYYLQRRWYGD